MKIYFINRICKDGESILPYADPFQKGYTDKNEALKIMHALMEEETIDLNEDGPEEKGWYYGITFDWWVTKFDENDNVVEYITKYSLEELEVER